MTIKRISTGIFGHDEISGLTKADRILLKQKAISLLNVEKRLENIGKYANDILRNHKENPEAVRDANLVLNYIGILRDAARENNINDAMLAALNLGQASIMLYVRPHEKPATTGRKTLAFNAMRRAARSRKVEKRHIKVIETFEEIEAQYEPHERPSQREIIGSVCNHLKMNPNTVKSILLRASKKSAK
jgi:hypothetical protein